MFIATAVVGLIGVFARLSVADAVRAGRPQRWFVPGTLGFEPGRTPGQFSTGTTGAFLTRAFSGLNDSEAQTWGKRNGLTPALAFSHHLSTVFPPELHASHPEFFPLVDGQRLAPPKGSYFWNPDIAREDVARFAGAAAARYFNSHPAAPSFALGVNDALIWGESPELRALATPTTWFRERPDYSRVVFTFMNRAAAELARTHPGKYLGALAYYWAENTPGFALHPQVIPFLTADRSQGYDEAFRVEERALQQKWGALARARNPDTPAAGAAEPPPRLGIYDYVYGGGFLIPRIHPRLIAEHLRHARDAGFTDYYAEVNPNWGLDGPMPWLTAQLVSDPQQDYAVLLDEYYSRYFGPAGAAMEEFFARCERQWLAQPGPSYWLKHYRNESQAILFPPAVCAELRALLDEAARQADAPNLRARVKLVSDAFGVTERFVAFSQARERLLRAALAGPAEAADLLALLARFLERRTEFVGYTDALRRTQPLALHPFDWSDYLKSDPVPAALFALRAARTQNAGKNASQLGDLRAAELERRVASDRKVAPLWRGLVSASLPPHVASAGSAAEMLVDAAMTGPLQPARTIAGLTYGVALPVGWQSKVEPAEHHRAEFTPAGGDRALRVEGTKDTMVSQWVAVRQPGIHRASIAVRGRVSPGNAVTLILAFLDAAHRHVGFKAVRLPDGEWPEWVHLAQAEASPDGAVWVGIGLRVQNQVHGDWVEAREFSVQAAGQ